MFSSCRKIMRNKENIDDPGEEDYHYYNDDDSINMKRFLVIGETGVGKTNTVNVLCGTKHEVSDSAIGTTFTFQRGIREDEELGYGVELTDTIGLSEGDAGKVHPAVAFAKLVAFAKDHEAGFNGIFLVVSSPKITKSMQENYRLFVEQVTSKKVPCYMFINKQEFEDYKLQYARNASKYEEAGFKFTYGFSGGCKMDEVRDFTIEQFKYCFKNAPAQAERLFEPNGYFTWIRKLWCKFMVFWAELTGKHFEPPKDDSFVGILVKLGVPEDIARNVAANALQNGLSDEVIEDLENLLKAARK